jgi:hypothetical protein
MEKNDSILFTYKDFALLETFNSSPFSLIQIYLF